MPFCLFVSLEDYLKLYLGHLVLQICVNNQCNIAPMEKSALATVCQSATTYLCERHTLGSFEVPMLHLMDRYSLSIRPVRNHPLSKERPKHQKLVTAISRMSLGLFHLAGIAFAIDFCHGDIIFEVGGGNFEE